MLLFSCLVIFSFIFFYRREGAYYGCIFSLLFDELVFIICFTTQISTLTIDELGKARIFAPWFFHNSIRLKVKVRAELSGDSFLLKDLGSLRTLVR